MLKMKNKCEKCETSTAMTELAYICSYECSFCESCAKQMNFICPNCDGELVKRPTRVKSPVAVIASQVSRKLFGK